jgi:hypothetical protein
VPRLSAFGWTALSAERWSPVAPAWKVYSLVPELFLYPHPDSVFVTNPLIWSAINGRDPVLQHKTPNLHQNCFLRHFD